MKSSSSSSSSFMVITQLMTMGMCCLALSSSQSAYPSAYGDVEQGGCVIEGLATPSKSDVLDGVGEIYDITHRLTPESPGWRSNKGIGEFLSLLESMKNGSDYNFSELRLPVHTGTHVDAPGHVYDHYFDAGFDVDSLDLRILNGPALLTDVPRDKNITDEVMKSLNIPRGVRRVLFRTLNTDRFPIYIISQHSLHLLLATHCHCQAPDVEKGVTQAVLGSWRMVHSGSWTTQLLNLLE